MSIDTIFLVKKQKKLSPLLYGLFIGQKMVDLALSLVKSLANQTPGKGSVEVQVQVSHL